MLRELLKLRTPHGAEHRIYPFIRKVAGKNRLFDDIGNCMVDYGGTTIFVAHMDDVGLEKRGKRRLFESGGMIRSEEVLGADDKAGVYILLRMIAERIPGRYIFTVGEECGLIGATHVSDSWLEGYSKCVEFDRQGTSSIITHQAGGRCCSDDFAYALGSALGMRPDAGGVFTDNSVWTDTIAECTNVSCGYYNAHSKREWLDAWWLERVLIPRVIGCDWDALPVVRVPEPEIWESSIPWYRRDDLPCDNCKTWRCHECDVYTDGGIEWTDHNGGVR